MSTPLHCNQFKTKEGYLYLKSLLGVKYLLPTGSRFLSLNFFHPFSRAQLQGIF